MQSLTDKQKKILAYIGDFMRKMGYPPTVREIGSHFRIASSSVFDHISALETKGALRKKSGKSRSFELVGQGSPYLPTPTLSNLEDVETVETVQIPLLGRVAAGIPLLAVQNIEEMITLPRHWVRNGKIFALQVHGDSMINDGIHDGDTILVRMQAHADEGDIVVALLENEATVKRFYKKANAICLRAANDKYQDIIARHVDILGKVIGLFRRY